MPDLEGLPKAYDPHAAEQEVTARWEASGYTNPDALPGERTKTFTVAIPPPNVTGSLHMGHALNATIQDILVRWKRMDGYKALWVPGTDHAGIATQNVVEKMLKKNGISRHDLGREAFIEKVWEWKEQYGGTIIQQLKRLGASCDWSRERFTMDAGYVKAVEAAFAHYKDKGLIYKGKRVVSWCPRCRTSLSDLELEYRDEIGSLWTLRYPVPERLRVAVGMDAVHVATTRPETMLGDEAVAVNPSDDRYKALAGAHVLLPLKEKEIPVVADIAVESTFGTGAVKVTPAHDLTDYDIGVRHALPLTQVIDERGRMTAEAGERYAGLTVAEARASVLADLEKGGYLVATEAYPHRVAVCYRCDTVVEPIPSDQWFVRMRELADAATAAVQDGRVRFHPKRWEGIYLDWLANVRDWCVSRQLWWGHRIPLTGEEDVLDTWFSSALWPFAILGWPEQTKDLKTFYPTQVLSTARDIINLWVARMVYSGLEFMGKEPFSDVYVHATVLTKDGKRMSKSKGTGIDPMKLIESYGADATRFGLAWMSLGGQDLKFGEEPMIAGKKFANKLWNASKFVMAKAVPPLTLALPENPRVPENAAMAEAVRRITRETTAALESYEFGQALHGLHDFFWHEFCDTYIEWSKAREDAETAQTLGATLSATLKLLHPFMPFITEAIWHHVRPEDDVLMVASWPQA